MHRAAVVLIGVLAAGSLAATQTRGSDAARSWVQKSAGAMGGEAKLRALHAVEIDGMSVLYQREQSERPEGPWVATYSDFVDVRNFAAGVVRRRVRARGYSTPDWVNNREWQPDATLLIADGMTVRIAGDRLMPAGTSWDQDALPLELGPDRLVLTALDSSDLHAEPDSQLHGYAHHVVSFTHRDARVRLILNVPDLLPKAVDVTRAHPTSTFWAPWGDVTTRVTFGIWTLEPEGIELPRLWEFSTAGQVDGRIDITRVRLNPDVVAADFAIPDDLRRAMAARRVDEVPFGSTQRPAKELVPGLVKVPSSWDIVEVKQNDGVVIIEGPLTSSYSQKVIDDAGRRFAGTAVTSVVTTSDSWPHIGGMREYVARGIPIYALDLNVPILNRLFAASYTTYPDALARAPKPARFRVVSSKTVVGAGPNRIELYPFRTASGERQMMAYFPEHKLLYTSDLFTLQGEYVFLPQQVAEAVSAVAREGLTVQSAFGMHYDVVPWSRVVEAAKAPSYAK